MKEQKYIGCQFRDKKTGEYRGRVYTYIADFPLVAGDMVWVETQHGETIIRVCDPNVPESKVDERIIPMLKEIVRRATPEEVEANG